MPGIIELASTPSARPTFVVGLDNTSTSFELAVDLPAILPLSIQTGSSGRAICTADVNLTRVFLFSHKKNHESPSPNDFTGQSSMKPSKQEFESD